jgi:glycosyltransferase involved in cell wall biosynthesis
MSAGDLSKAVVAERAHVGRPSANVAEAARPRGVDDRAIALLSLVSDGFGGLESHVLELARRLQQAGRRPLVVVAPGSKLHEAARDHRLPCHPVRWMPWVRGQPIRNVLLAHTLVRLAGPRGLAAIHCNNRFEVGGALRAARRLQCACVLNYHVPGPFDTSILKGLTAFIAPNAGIVSFVAQENDARDLGLAAVEQIPPLVDTTRLRAFDDQRPPRRWFADNLGLSLHDGPVVCMVGNMVPDLLHKNYPLLFQALQRLRHQEGLRVQALLVGDGPARPHLEAMADQLGLSEDVHFLGYRSPEVPGIIAKSDLLVLASSHEAFGIVLVEAALMRKAAVAARRTGAESIIVDRETGLLFDNGDEASLARAISTLLRDPAWAASLAARAYERANELFTPEVVLQRYLGLYGIAQPC